MLKKIVMSLALVGLFASIAYANLILDLRVEGASDPHNVTISAGSTTPLVLDVYATIEGAANNSSLTDAIMRFTSVESGTASLMGNMSSPTLGATWSALGGLGTAQNYDANPDVEWGGTYPTNSSASYYYAITITPPMGNIFLLGTITWTPTSAMVGGIDTLQVVPFVRNDSGIGLDSYMQDGITYTNRTATLNPGGINSGTAITLTAVPEPSTFTVFGIGIIGLLAYAWRRRKRGT